VILNYDWLRKYTSGFFISKILALLLDFPNLGILECFLLFCIFFRDGFSEELEFFFIFSNNKEFRLAIPDGFGIPTF